MANDVSIIVSADLGDTLIKLDLAKHAVNDLGDASEETAVKQDAAAVSTGFFTDMLGGMNKSVNLAIPMLGQFQVPLVALPAIAIAAATAVVAVADAFGTLIAIVADAVAPITLVAGLLGSLGLGFVLAAERAAHGGGNLQIFADKLATLHSMFSKTTDILAHAFLPYLLQLAGAAQQALLFVDKLAREPLAKAFHDMATQGVQMLTRFVGQVASVLAHPFRLAIKIAFGAGPGGNEIASAVSGFWHQFTRYLLGYADTHPVFAKDGKFLGITTTNVQGALQPILDWFNRHHFTRQGEQIATDILGGLKKISGPISGWLSHVILDAAIKTGPYAGHLLAYGINHGLLALDAFLLRMWNKFKAEAETAGIAAAKAIVGAVITAAPVIVHTLSNAWNDVKSDASGVWSAIKTIIHTEIAATAGLIAGEFSSAWNAVKREAESAWNYIKGLFSQALSLHISIPSLPSPGSILGGIGSTLGGVIPHLGGGGGGTHFHFHAGPGMSGIAERAAFERFARQVGQAQARQQGLLAGGH